MCVVDGQEQTRLKQTGQALAVLLLEGVLPHFVAARTNASWARNFLLDLCPFVTSAWTVLIRPQRCCCLLTLFSVSLLCFLAFSRPVLLLTVCGPNNHSYVSHSPACSSTDASSSTSARTYALVTASPLLRRQYEERINRNKTGQRLNANDSLRERITELCTVR